MKTVSGTIVSSKPVNLTKAANILSKFVKSDNGASQAVSAYLRRASEAFNEHVYFKKHHKLKKNRSKEEASTISDITHRDIEENEGTIMEDGDAVNREFDQDPVEIDENGANKAEGKLRKKDKKKKKAEDLESGKSDNSGVGLENVIEVVKEKSEEKKKNGDAVNREFDQDPVEIDENGVSKAEGKLRKKDKKKKSSGDLESGRSDNTEVGLENIIEAVKERSEEKKKKKKRRNAEVDGGEIGNSVTPEKKKRRKTKSEE